MSTNFDEIITYSVTDANIASLKAEFMPLVVNGFEDKEGYELCKKARIRVKSLRCDVEKRRKELKQDSLEFGRLVDSKAKAVTNALLEIETHLQSQQDIVDKEKLRRQQQQEAEARAKLQARIDALQECQVPFNVESVRQMTDEQFALELGAAKIICANRIATEKAEKERLALLEAERIEQQRKLAEQEAEAKRLRDELLEKQRAEIAEQERKLAEIREAERKAQEAKAEAERALERERLAALAEQERVAKEAEKARLAELAAKEAAEAEARKAIKDAELFEWIKAKFPTLEAAWVEIARLNNILEQSGLGL